MQSATNPGGAAATPLSGKSGVIWAFGSGNDSAWSGAQQRTVPIATAASALGDFMRSLTAQTARGWACFSSKLRHFDVFDFITSVSQPAQREVTPLDSRDALISAARCDCAAVSRSRHHLRQEAKFPVRLSSYRKWP
jgi:hypothetical protein